MSVDTSKILGPPTGYIDLLDEATTAVLEREAAITGGMLKTPIRPSAAGKCTRELALELNEFHGFAQYKKPLKTPEVHRLLDLGSPIEWHVIKQFALLKDVFELRYKQQVLSFEYLQANNPKLSQWVEGSLDLVLWSEKYKCVADVKSKKDGFVRPWVTRWDEMTGKLREMKSVTTLTDKTFWADNLEDFLEELNDPFFEANFLQLNMYANSSFLMERGVNHGAIFQYCKNDSRLREIRFRPSPGLYQEVLTKFKTAIKAVDEQNIELAPKDYNDDSFKCRYCNFKKECWGKRKPKAAGGAKV